MAANPMLFGYQLVRVNTSPEEVENGGRLLAAFAALEGFALGTVFVERDACRPWSALAALIESARRLEVAAVAVPRVTDLGLQPLVQQLTRRRLEADAGLRVLVLGAVA